MENNEKKMATEGMAEKPARKPRKKSTASSSASITAWKGKSIKSSFNILISETILPETTFSKPPFSELPFPEPPFFESEDFSQTGIVFAVENPIIISPLPCPT